MDFKSIIEKYSKVNNELCKQEIKLGKRTAPISVLDCDLKVLKEEYKKCFGKEPDNDALLFGRKVIEIKL